MLKRKALSFFYTYVVLVVGFIISGIAFVIYPVIGYAIMSGLFVAYYRGNLNAKNNLVDAEKFSVKSITSLTTLVMLLTVSKSDSQFIYADRKEVTDTIKSITAVMKSENDRIMG